MYDNAVTDRFIHLRCQGWSLSRIMVELNVSRPTLINWSRKFQFEIQNFRAVELESLREKWLASVAERVNVMGEQYMREAIRLRKKYPDVFGPRAMENYLDILRTEEQRHQIDAALRKIYDVKNDAIKPR